MKLLLFLSLLLTSFSLLAQNYQSAESVEYDAANDRWLVANGSNIIIDDGQGNLGTFGTGTASHGMEIMGNTLFAIGSNVIRGYDLTTQAEVMSISIAGVGFLNGMASNGTDMLWVTDFSTQKIHAIDVSDLNNPSSTEIVAATGGTPNGILYDSEDRLLFVTWGNNASIKAVDLSDNSVSDIVANTGVGNIDGIVKFDGEYIISSWSPARLTRYREDFSGSDVESTPSLNSPADIGVNAGEGIVGIPMGDEVIFVALSPTAGIDDVSFKSIGFKLSENPISVNSYIEFNLKEEASVSIDLFNMEGKLIKEISFQERTFGFNRYALNASGIASGTYILSVSIDELSLSKKVIVK